MTSQIYKLTPCNVCGAVAHIYCNRRNFRTRKNFVLWRLPTFAREKFSYSDGGVRCTCIRVWFSYATKFHTFRQKYEIYEIKSRMKICAITVPLFFSACLGSRVLLRRPIEALHTTDEGLSFTARCSLSFCDIGKWSCDQRETFDRIFWLLVATAPN